MLRNRNKGNKKANGSTATRLAELAYEGQDRFLGYLDRDHQR